jgi:hypothetical protein
VAAEIPVPRLTLDRRLLHGFHVRHGSNGLCVLGPRCHGDATPDPCLDHWLTSHTTPDYLGEQLGHVPLSDETVRWLRDCGNVPVVARIDLNHDEPFVYAHRHVSLEAEVDGRCEQMSPITHCALPLIPKQARRPRRPAVLRVPCALRTDPPRKGGARALTVTQHYVPGRIKVDAEKLRSAPSDCVQLLRHVCPTGALSGQPWLRDLLDGKELSDPKGLKDLEELTGCVSCGACQAACEAITEDAQLSEESETAPRPLRGALTLQRLDHADVLLKTDERPGPEDAPKDVVEKLWEKAVATTRATLEAWRDSLRP